ncbi:MAG: DNA-processing protein DprA, partial [Pseudomonadota bacterium]
LARSTNVGPRSYVDLIRRFGTASRALEALPSLARRGGKRGYVPFATDLAVAELEAGDAADARLLILGDADYPAFLSQIDNPPPVLWVQGDTAFARNSAVAVVGARNASALGLRTCRRIVGELGEAGHVIVSGLARGIDAEAHRTALKTGTIAVLAGGIDRIYPEEHGELANQIRETGLLLSECPMGVEPTSRHFPKRNRLISGLSKAVLLIEAAVRSGSLITARYALEQGRDVMACPGSPEDPRAGGCNALIRDGAILVRSSDDVIDALASPLRRGLGEPGNAFLFDGDEYDEDILEGGIDDFDGLDETAEGTGDLALTDQVLNLIGPNPVDIDEIARQCGANPAEMSLVMLELDLAGQIDLLPGGQVTRAGDLG